MHVLPVLYAVLSGFTAWSKKRHSAEVIGVLDLIFQELNLICHECMLVKMKTIGKKELT